MGLVELSQSLDEYKHEEVQNMVQKLTKKWLLVTTLEGNGEQNVEIVHPSLVTWNYLADEMQSQYGWL
jgi:hypothetical protein